MSSAHEGKQTTCHHGHPTDDHEDHDDMEPTTLTFDEHGRYVRSPSGEDRFGTHLRERFESSALRFDCPDCDRTHWACPVCSDHLDPDADNPHQAPGWFYGDSTGEAIACHNCNAAEAARQDRRAV